jgi:peptide/nickel transport system substrate-binding protein
MVKSKFKLGVRKQIRLSRKTAETFGHEAGKGIEKNFIRRLGQLTTVRRFVISWILLAVLLSGAVVAQIITLSDYYQQLQPRPGGVYNEGILGDYTNINPIYATGPVDMAASRLIFAGLLKYDENNKLATDLASNWSVNSIGTVYTVYLKSHLLWQDGKPLTAQDVAFTYRVIQNADAQSPLQTSWQGISITSPDSRTIIFTLPNPLSSFPYSLTTGIIPQHILSKTPMSEMRSTTFNTLNPIGSGPFRLNLVDVLGNTPQTKEEEVELLPNADYHSGQVKLSEFVIRAFHDPTALLNSFNKGELKGMAGLPDIPANLQEANTIDSINFPLTAQVMVFFKTSGGILGDINVRQALVKGSDTGSIISGLGYPALPVKEPLLLNQLGYNPSYNQFSFNRAAAEQQLTNDGWILGADGIRHKDGQPLQFTLSAADTIEYNYIAKTLQHQWKLLGVNLKLVILDDTDLQNTVNTHSYDSIIYGISIGVDPDVFVSWDSTQFDPRSPVRLNLSEYSSATADEALEQGRTRIDPTLRVVKYKPFLQVWQQNAPALALYQPRFLYVTRGKVFGLSQQTINTGADRYTNVQNWEIRQVKVTN